MNKIITQFYEAFKNLNAEKMVECYHNDIIFCDPAFGELKGERAKNMWRMLCSTAKDLSIEYSEIKANQQSGTAHWEAKYTFSQTGKKVHNIIKAKFEFKDGKIIKHTDNFSMYNWSKQALGLPGLLLGWTPLIKHKIQTKTNLLLDKFERKNT